MHDEPQLAPTWTWHTASTLTEEGKGGGPLPGTKLGEYLLLEELGRGGMGVVYRAVQPAADRVVALKVIRPDKLEGRTDSDRRGALDRFLTEARATARLTHDHLVTVFDVGEAQGCPYYAMRLVEGRSLSEILRDGPLANRRAAAYLEPICRAIQEAHDQGIVHRDIKPGNILVEARGDRPLITDFGLAKWTGDGRDVTLAGEVFGSPPYMAPEQARDAATAVAAADIYGLGATLYHAVTGRPPFQAASAAETLRQVIAEEPVPPRQLNPDIDRDLETILLKCLAKEPPRRYLSAAALADELARYGRGEPIRARPLGRAGRLWRWARRNPKLAAVSTLLLLALGFLGGAFWQVDAVAFQRDRAVGAEGRANARRDEALTSNQAAQEAERLKRIALAESLANQGFLAMQRGRMREAPALFDRAIAEGYPQAGRLRLEKVEAWIATRNIDAAAAELAALAVDPESGPYRGQVLLWQAELALGPRPDDSAEALLQSALDAGLPPAEEQYALGMLAETSPQAVAHFAAALRLDPFHFPAQGASATLLIFLGRPEEAERQLSAATVLFPEDHDLVLSRAAALALRGDAAAAREYLDGMAGTLSAAELDFGRELAAALDEIAHSAAMLAAPNGRGSPLPRLLSLLVKMQAADLPLGGGMRLPPRIARKLALLPPALAPLFLGKFSSFGNALTEIVEVHPEGTLYFWLGVALFAQERYDEAIAACDLAVQTPALGRGVAEMAGTTAAMCRAHLALRGQVHAEFLPAAHEAVRRRMAAAPLDDFQLATVSHVFARVALESADYPLAREILVQWETRVGASLELHRMRMFVEYRAGGYQAGMEAADQVLLLAPDDAQAADVRTKALEKLKAVIETRMQVQ